MANFPFLKMTAAGRDAQAKAQTGQVLKFTRVGLGDGEFSGDPDGLTALVNEKHSLSIQDVDAPPGSGTAVLQVIMTNQGLIEGFYHREMATFVEDPDTGAEVMYSYTNAGAQCDFLPPAGGAVVWEGVFELITIVGNAANVTAVLDDFITIALKSEVNALKPYLLPHGGTVGQLLVKKSNDEGDSGWESVDINGLDVRFASVEEPRVAVANQSTFTLRKTITNGLAVYVAGKRLSREAWTPLSATQLKLTDPLAVGTAVLFVNNEETGPSESVGISLEGPTLVYPGSTNTFVIGAFDSFSPYTQTSTAGTLTRSGKTLTLVMASNAVAGTLDIQVGCNGVTATRRVAVGAAALATPEIVTPGANATGVGFQPDIVATPFAAYPSGYEAHAKTRWQVARDAAFTNIVFDQNLATNLTAVNLAAAGIRLTSATRYYARVQYAGATLTSSWSPVVSFNTATVFIQQPRITSPVDGKAEVPESPVLTADAFSVYGSTDSHAVTDWRILDANKAVVWQSLNDSVNKTSIVVPAGFLQAGQKTYTAQVKYTGSAYGPSEWSPEITFVTALQFIPTVPGTAFAGGYYAGRFKVGSQAYALIVAPKATGNTTTTFWTGSGGYSEATTALSVSDGLANTNLMIGNTNLTGPRWARNLRIGGYDDWYIPSQDELEICYRYLKPTTGANQTYSSSYAKDPGKNNSAIPATVGYTAAAPVQTANAAFKAGGAEAFDAKRYWCSTGQVNASYIGWVQDFTSGLQDGQNSVYYSNTVSTRAVRRIPIPS